jgi:hypothetical protein
MMTGLQKSQRTENQTPGSHLDELRNVGVKIRHHITEEQTHPIEYRTWFYNKKRRYMRMREREIDFYVIPRISNAQ